MSFITKRDRIFTEVDLSDLPPRNEGKLKAYASLVDARAWSHYNSDKSEHLFELIKRNTGKCKQQLIPIDVIVNTLMGAKNAEIDRLKGRINQMERLLSAYEKMDLTPEQKAYIKKARAAILESSSDLISIKGDGDGQRVLFDANGNPIGGYDSNGNPMVGGMYDANGNPIAPPFFDDNGNSIGSQIFENEEIDTKEPTPVSVAVEDNTDDANEQPINPPYFDAVGNPSVTTDDCTCEILPSGSDTCFSTCLSVFSGVSKGAPVCPCERPCDNENEAKICPAGAAKIKRSKIPIPDPDSRLKLSNVDTSQNIKEELTTDTPPRAASCIPIPLDRQSSVTDNKSRSRSLVASNLEASMKNLDRAENKPCVCKPVEMVSATTSCVNIRSTCGSIVRENRSDTKSLRGSCKSGTERKSIQGSICQSAKDTKSICGSIYSTNVNNRGAQPQPLPIRGSCISRSTAQSRISRMSERQSAHGSCINRDADTQSIRGSYASKGRGVSSVGPSISSKQASRTSKGPEIVSVCPSKLSNRVSGITKDPETLLAYQGTLSAQESCIRKGPEIPPVCPSTSSKRASRVSKGPEIIPIYPKPIGGTSVCNTNLMKTDDDNNMDSLKEKILEKDAELATMQNTISTESKDITDLDLRAKIIFKLNVLEKFSSALTMGCTKNNHGSPNTCKGCLNTECYHAEVLSYLNPSFDMSNTDYSDLENNFNRIKDDDRAKLVAQIIKADDFNSVLQSFDNDFSNKIQENDDSDNMALKIKELQECYDELLNAYSDLKDERDSLVSKILECEEALQELEDLKYKYQELSRQNDYYQSFVEEANKVKEESIVLLEQAETLEDELKHQKEINQLNNSKLVHLSDENTSLHKHIEDMSINFEEEKKQLKYKVSELECCASCQETEISSLAIQVDTLMNSQKMSESRSLADTIELSTIKRQLSNLKDLLATSQKENEELQRKLSEYEKLLQAVQSEFHNIQDECEALVEQNHNLELDKDELRKELDNKDREIIYLTVKVGSLTQISYTDSQEGPPSCPDNQLYYKETFRDQSETAITEGSNNTDQKSEEVIRSTDKQSRSVIEKKVSFYDVSTSQKLENLELHHGVIGKNSEELIMQSKANEKLVDELRNKTMAYDLLYEEKIQLQNELLKYVENIPEQHEFEFEITSIKNSYMKLKSENDDLKNDLSKQKQRENDLIIHNQRLQNLLDGNIGRNPEYAFQDDLFITQLEQEINQLRESNNLMKEENERILNDLEKMRESNGVYENNFLSSKQSIDKLSEENNILKGVIEDLKYSIDLIKRERESLLNDHESYVHRNTVEFKKLESHLSGIKESCNDLEQENKNLKIELEKLREENDKLTQERDRLMRLSEEINKRTEDKEKNFEDRLNSLNEVYGKLESDHKNLQIKLATSDNDNKKIKIEMQDLQNELTSLLEQKNDLFNRLNKMSKEKSLPEVSAGLKDCLQEIEQLKMDVMKNQNIIDSLSSQLNFSEKKATDLNIKLIEQANKNEIMQSQITNLEQEIVKLHGHLDIAISSGELKGNSLKAVEKSLAETQAHHSRATHDIKSELMALQISHLKSDESTSLNNSVKAQSDNSTISSKLFSFKTSKKNLQKHVESLESATTNALKALNKDTVSPGQTVNNSLEIITKTMERQDLNYQNLERLYLEAKSTAQSISYKYEELKEELENVRNQYMKEKYDLEQQFYDEKQNLLAQIQYEKNSAQILKDERMEQSKEIENFRKNTNTSIRELESELEILKDIYSNALHTIGDLNKKNSALINDNNKIQNILDIVNEEMKTKLKDIDDLENELKQIRPLEVRLKKDVTTQTDLESTITETGINKSSLSLLSLQSINVPINSEGNKNFQYTENVSEINASVSGHINLVRSMQSTLNSDEQASIIYSVKELSILRQALQETNNTDSAVNKLNIDVLTLKVSSHSDSIRDDLKVHLVEPSSILYSSNENYNLKALDAEKQTQSEVKLSHIGTQSDEFVDSKLLNDIEEYKIKIQTLTSTVTAGERDLNIKLAAIKTQFDNNMRNIINEHNEGIERMQTLHEETVRDLIRQHESEIENLRAINAEGVKVTEGLMWKNKELRKKLNELMGGEKENASKMYKNLTVTTVELFNIKPKKRHAPTVCAIDSSETNKNDFEKGDTDDGKLAAQNFFRSIIKKVFDGGIEVLDLQELSYLHQKVCHIWKSKQSKDDGTQKKTGPLENDLFKRKQNTIQRIMELEAAVREERKRLNEVRDTMYSDMISTDKPPSALECHCNDGVEVSSHVQEIPCTVSQRKTKAHGPRLVCKCTPQTSKQTQPQQYENEPPTRLKDVTPRKNI